MGFTASAMMGKLYFILGAAVVALMFIDGNSFPWILMGR